MAFQKVRSAPRVPGLLLCTLPVMFMTACGEQVPDKEPVATVDLPIVNETPVAAEPKATDEAQAPGFSTVNGSRADPSSRLTTGDQLVDGTIIDFMCETATPLRGDSDTTKTPTACELVIRTETRGDRRLICDIAPCDAWSARGSLPQGIRGLQAEAWITLADTYDPSGNPIGRVAKVKRLNVAYTKKR